MKNIHVRVSDFIYERMMKLKETDGFAAYDWGKWFEHISRNIVVNNTLADNIGQNTKDKLLDMWLENFSKNVPFIKEEDAINLIAPVGATEISDPEGPAIIVGAGPSIWQHNHLDLLQKALKSSYKGIVISTDKMLAPLLERGIKPQYVVSVDGSPIIQNFYNPPIVQDNLPDIGVILAATVNPEVAEVVRKGKGHIYWFTAIADSAAENDSFTRIQRVMTRGETHPNGAPSLSCGGNTGATSWVISSIILRRSPNILIGFDMGYPKGTPLQETPYFSSVLVGGASAIKGSYQDVHHPVFHTEAIVDMVFEHYRRNFKDLAIRMPFNIETWNCTEGGALWGIRINCMKFADALSKLEKTNKGIAQQVT